MAAAECIVCPADFIPARGDMDSLLMLAPGADTAARAATVADAVVAKQ